MILEDFHVHTSYCDGKNTPSEIVEEAVKKGLTRIGFSGHSYTFFDESYCMSTENTKKYLNEIRSLEEKYKEKIDVLCGIELDYYSDFDAKDFDYIIGSVHYIKQGDKYLPIDESAAWLQNAVNEYFDGDPYSLAEEYFRTVSDVVKKTKANIIGHFDLVSKFNEMMPMFDETHPRYVKAYKKAIDKLLPFNVPFEVNTGAISRGCKTVPYPAFCMVKYIKENGGRFILSSDSHSKDTLLYGFENYKKWL